MRSITLTTGLVAFGAVLLAACATNPGYDNGREYRSGCHNCGTIDRVERVRLKNQEQDIGVGAVLGAIIGGVAGSNVGSGDERTIATAVGAVAGGVIGHQIQKNNSRQQRGYQFDVQLDDGRRAQVTQLEKRICASATG